LQPIFESNYRLKNKNKALQERMKILINKYKNSTDDILVSNSPGSGKKFKTNPNNIIKTVHHFSKGTVFFCFEIYNPFSQYFLNHNQNSKSLTYKNFIAYYCINHKLKVFASNTNIAIHKLITGFKYLLNLKINILQTIS
jgi:hypothetical protein